MDDFFSTIIAMTREGLDLSLRQCAVLHAVSVAPEAARSTRHIAAALLLSKPAITRATQALEGKGYAKNARGMVGDQRAVNLTVTKDGAALLARIAGGFQPKGKRASAREKVSAT